MRTNHAPEASLIDGGEFNGNVISGGKAVLNAARRWGAGSWMVYISLSAKEWTLVCTPPSTKTNTC